MKKLFLIVCLLAAQAIAYEPAHHLVVYFGGVSAYSSCPLTGWPEATCIVSGNFGGGMYILTLSEDKMSWSYSDQDVTSTECWQYPHWDYCGTATGIVITAVKNYNPDYALYIMAASPPPPPDQPQAIYFRGGVASLNEGWIYIQSIPNENQNCLCLWDYPVWHGGVGGIVMVAELPGCAPGFGFGCFGGLGNCWRKQIEPPDDCQKYDVNFNGEVDLEDLAIILSYGWLEEE